MLSSGLGSWPRMKLDELSERRGASPPSFLSLILIVQCCALTGNCYSPWAVDSLGARLFCARYFCAVCFDSDWYSLSITQVLGTASYVPGLLVYYGSVTLLGTGYWVLLYLCILYSCTGCSLLAGAVFSIAQ